MAESRLDILKRIGMAVVGKLSGAVEGTAAAVSPSTDATRQSNMGDELAGLMRDAIDLDMQRNNLLEQNYDATMQVVRAIQDQMAQQQRNIVAQRRSAREVAAEGISGAGRAVGAVGRGVGAVGRAPGALAGALSGAFSGLLGAPGKLLSSVASGIGAFANPATVIGAGIIAGLGFGFIKLLEGITKFVENNSVGELIKEGGTLALLVGGLGMVAAKVSQQLLLPALAVMGGLTLAALGIAYAIDIAAPGLAKLTDSLTGLTTAAGGGSGLLDLALGLGALALALPAFAASTAMTAGIQALSGLFGAGNPLSEISKMLENIPSPEKVEGLGKTLDNISQRLKIFTGEMEELNFDSVKEAADALEQINDAMPQTTLRQKASMAFEGLRSMVTGEEAQIQPGDPRVVSIPDAIQPDDITTETVARQIPTAVPAGTLPVTISNLPEQAVPVEFTPTAETAAMLGTANIFNADQYVVHNHYNSVTNSTNSQSVDARSVATVVTPPAIAGVQ